MMTRLYWNKISKLDILKAVEFFNSEKPTFSNPHKLFLIVDGKEYPAKTIRKIAYNLKNNTNISEDNFKGGSFTVKFYNKLGFDIKYNNQLFYAKDYHLETDSKSNHIKEVNGKIKISQKNLLQQKNELQKILNKLFDGDLVTEKSFEWMRPPKDPEKTYPQLYKSLKDYRQHDNFVKNRKLQCDFVSESNKIIIEYDERQHFTEPRRISLLNYPDIPVYFDKEKWIKASEDIQAVGDFLYNSDVARAYYDSIRDIEAYNHGYKLFRIMHNEFDFEREDACEYLIHLFKL